MVQEKTKKVLREFIVRYEILSDVVVSPVRIEILNKLSDSQNGLYYKEIVNRIPDDLRQRNIQKHLYNLVKEGIVIVEADAKDGKTRYVLSKLGEETYSTVTKVAERAKSEQVFSNTQYVGTKQ
jgi:DNA-binding HxlR family transcriptional regulator